MSCYVYILRSCRNNRYYIGSTKNIEKRLKDHNQGKVRSTKSYIPWILLFKERCLDLTEARQKEIKLKRMKNRKALEHYMACSSSLVQSRFY